jgi:hypothetical protein
MRVDKMSDKELLLPRRQITGKTKGDPPRIMMLNRPHKRLPALRPRNAARVALRLPASRRLATGVRRKHAVEAVIGRGQTYGIWKLQADQPEAQLLELLRSL